MKEILLSWITHRGISCLTPRLENFAPGGKGTHSLRKLYLLCKVSRFKMRRQPVFKGQMSARYLQVSIMQCCGGSPFTLWFRSKSIIAQQLPFVCFQFIPFWVTSLIPPPFLCVCYVPLPFLPISWIFRNWLGNWGKFVNQKAKNWL